MKHVPTVMRLFLGLIFFVFGLNFFLHFVPMPPPPAEVVPFMTGMMSTKYLFPLIGLTQTLVGAALLLNIFVPLALVLIAPVIINIFCFHLFLEPQMALPIVLVILELGLAYFYRDAYKPLLHLKTKPNL